MTSSPSKLPFECHKQPASGPRGVVVTNAPVASMAGAEMLSAGGNAVDAAVAALLTLTVVEPMMVGIVGGGISHVRLADGRHVVVDAQSCAGSAMTPDMFTPDPAAPRFSFAAEGRRNEIGPSSVAVPGNLQGWCLLHEKYGRLPFADVVEPAIRAATRGFPVSSYFRGCTLENQDGLRSDPTLSSVLFEDGEVRAVGSRVTMPEYAESLRLIQAEGAAALHGGALGRALVESMQTCGPSPGCLTMEDLTAYRALERAAIVGTYRGYAIFGPPPPASSGVHIAQMLNILEGYDLKAMGFASAESMHLLAEVIRIAFEDRRLASGDPAFVDVPVAKYTSKTYAAEARTRIREAAGLHPLQRMEPSESADTTHLTVADRDGMIVTATHTINGIFGARYTVPGTGIIPNNYMVNFDPVPGRAMSIVPSKRVPTSMAPMIVTRDGAPAFALGLPGGKRIFPSALQAIVNLIDHGMSLQEAVEAPRLWTEGDQLEIEEGYAFMQSALEARGHEVRRSKTLGGGMSAIAFAPDGTQTGAACWRADGTVVALGGGLAQPGARFRL